MNGKYQKVLSVNKALSPKVVTMQIGVQHEPSVGNFYGYFCTFIFLFIYYYVILELFHLHCCMF